MSAVRCCETSMHVNAGRAESSRVPHGHFWPGKIAPPIAAADKSLETGKLQEVAQLISKRTEQGLHRTFEAVMAKKKYNPNDVAAGRVFSSAYVEYTHYVERLYDAAETLAPERVQEKAVSAHTH